MLSKKQDEFAILLSNGCSQADAYRQAYNAGNMKDTSIYVEGSRLKKNPKVALRIEELSREKDVDRRMQVVKREDFVLDGLTREAETALSASARIRALELIGKTIGLFTGRSEKVVEPELTSAELKKKITDKLSKYLNIHLAD